MPPSPAWHERPAVQVFAAPPPQHAWPVPPQATHIMLEHVAPGPVQVMPPPVPQQLWVSAPQVPHEPFMHMPDVPPPVQVDPAAMQVPPTQQPPLLQVFAAQQSWPGPPQAVVPPAPAVPPAPPRPADPP
jgi:hypothetical protein